MHGIKVMWTLHEPQGAAGILPAEEPEKSAADETSAAPCWRHRPARSGSWSQCMRRKAERGLSMNRRWYGVPPLGGCVSPDRLKPELHAIESSWSQCTASKPWGLSMNLPQTNPPLTHPRRGTCQVIRLLPERGWGRVQVPSTFPNKMEYFHKRNPTSRDLLSCLSVEHEDPIKAL